MKKNRHVISFVARSSNSGKTTLIEKIVTLLKARGLRVAVVKHTSSGFDLDKPGKDSWRFQQAGADAVILAGQDQVALMKRVRPQPSRHELEQLAGAVDIVIYEGFKDDAENKIEVFRQGISGDFPLCMHDASFLALVSDKPFDVPIPCFDLNDAPGVADFIVTRMAYRKECSG